MSQSPSWPWVNTAWLQFAILQQLWSPFAFVVDLRFPKSLPRGRILNQEKFLGTPVYFQVITSPPPNGNGSTMDTETPEQFSKAIFVPYAPFAECIVYNSLTK